MGRLKVTIDRTAEFERAIRTLVQREVLVGIPDENAERKPGPDEQGPITNAAIGFLMETGSPAQNIPARPFLSPGVRDVSDEIAERLASTIKAALSGPPAAAVEKGLTAVGLIAEAAVKSRITDGPFEALAASTLKARKARGRTGEKPLVDTGQLRNAVTHVIRPASGRGRKGT